MKFGKFSGVVAFSLTAGLFGGVPSAEAGNVTNAVLACHVDTNALDPVTNNMCRSVWTPSTASNPTIAVFEVRGLTAGRYSYTWTDLETGGNPGCGTSQSSCVVGIATDVSGDGRAQLSVLIRDLDTGATKTVQATARYLDGWH